MERKKEEIVQNGARKMVNELFMNTKREEKLEHMTQQLTEI